MSVLLIGMINMIIISNCIFVYANVLDDDTIQHKSGGSKKIKRKIDNAERKIMVWFCMWRNGIKVFKQKYIANNISKCEQHGNRYHRWTMRNICAESV